MKKKKTVYNKQRFIVFAAKLWQGFCYKDALHASMCVSVCTNICGWLSFVVARMAYIGKHFAGYGLRLKRGSRSFFFFFFWTEDLQRNCCVPTLNERIKKITTNTTTHRNIGQASKKNQAKASKQAVSGSRQSQDETRNNNNMQEMEYIIYFMYYTLK